MRTSIVLLFTAALLLSCGGRGKGTAGTEDSAVIAPVRTIALSEEILAANTHDTIDFGKVKEGDVVMERLWLENTGATPIVVTRVDLTCGCIAAEYPQRPIMPGERGEMTLTFDSGRLGGWVYKLVQVHTSAAAPPLGIVVLAEIE